MAFWDSGPLFVYDFSVFPDFSGFPAFQRFQRFQRFSVFSVLTEVLQCFGLKRFSVWTEALQCFGPKRFSVLDRSASVFWTEASRRNRRLLQSKKAACFSVLEQAGLTRSTPFRRSPRFSARRDTRAAQTRVYSLT